MRSPLEPVNHPSRGSTYRDARGFLFAGMAILFIHPLARTDGPHPLQPPDTSSPRATLQSFLDNTREAHRLIAEKLSRKERETLIA